MILLRSVFAVFLAQTTTTFEMKPYIHNFVFNRASIHDDMNPHDSGRAPFSLLRCDDSGNFCDRRETVEQVSESYFRTIIQSREFTLIFYFMFFFA